MRAPENPKQAAKHASDKDAVPDTEERAAPRPVATQGTLYCSRDCKPDTPLPLQHTAVRAFVSGIVGHTQVTQTFTNGHAEPIEAVYCFPLPHNAAITDFAMRIGKRRIHAVLRPRAEAEHMYAEAVGRGQTAAIMTRERANVFNHYIGNIEPGARVDVEITYLETIRQQDGSFEWVFPMVVGPYYIAGTPLETETMEPGLKGHGVSPDTDRVPDASRVTPPTLPDGLRSGHDISLQVTLDAGFEIDTIDAATHKASVEATSPRVRTVKLDAGDAIPDRDFILRWTLKQGGPMAVLLTHRPHPDQHGYFTLMLRPDPANDAPRAAREITFVMDVSGSMEGAPVKMCQQVVTGALDGLTSHDTFNIFYFSGGSGSVFRTHQPATPDNVNVAKSGVAALKADGVTNMLEGLKAAMNHRTNGGREQLFCFLTDGYVGESKAIIDFVAANSGNAEFLVFGVGRSVNRDLVDGVALAGSGRAVYCIPDESHQDEAAVAAFLQFINTGGICGITLDWGSLPVSDIVPGGMLPVMQKGQVIAVSGRYSAAGEGSVSLVGAIGEAIAVKLPETASGSPGLRPLWAAWTIQSKRLQLPPDGNLRAPAIDDLAALAVAERLATEWTAFVAVDGSSRVTLGGLKTVVQPVEIPKGVSRTGTGR